MSATNATAAGPARGRRRGEKAATDWLRRVRRLAQDHHFTPLGRELDVPGAAAEILPPGRHVAAEAVKEIVAVERVVVEQQEPLCSHAVTEGECVGQRRVSPPEMALVLLIGVLTFVDQQGGAVGLFEAGDPILVEIGQRRAKPGLVIGDVAE
ncbi:MAG: hypothetical protein QOD66_4130, partial [Solirubrobacteraceae bacterium]|nr:hypothetical protein [Solirubrobacteraceae bacterium]